MNNHVNVSVEEIAKFNSVAAEWWDPSGPFKPLHELNPLRINYINEKLDLVNKQVLDIGCGGGLVCEALTQRGAQVMGIDQSNIALKVAKQHASSNLLDINYSDQPAEALLATHNNHFDVVTCLELLEHVPDPKLTVTTASQLVKPGGHVFFSTINRTAKAFLFAIIGAEYLLKLLPKGTHQYQNFIKPAELSRWARTTGLHLQEIIGVQYNPLTKAFKRSTKVEVNYLVHAIKPMI